MATRFTVVTTTQADNELMTIWISEPAGLRTDVGQAADAIDRELAQDAHQKGTLVDLGPPALRFFDWHPLRAIYEVSEPDRLVRITHYQRLVVP